jgi:anti-anti-sigma factor
MEIKRISPEEIEVRFTANPTSSDTQDWIGQVKEELTGSETSVRVDLTALSILSSLGVNVVVGIYQRINKQGGSVRVDVASEKTKRVFELFQLTGLLDVRVVNS